MIKRQWESIRDIRKSIFWHGLTKKKNQAGFHKFQCSAETEIEPLTWGFSPWGVCFGEGLQEWQRSSRHLNDELERTGLSATHRAGSVHFPQTITHHVLYFLRAFLRASGPNCAVLEICRCHTKWHLKQSSHWVFTNIKYWAFVWTPQNFPPFFPVTENSISSDQSDVIKSTNCDADMLHHWVTEKISLRSFKIYPQNYLNAARKRAERHCWPRKHGREVLDIIKPLNPDWSRQDSYKMYT